MELLMPIDKLSKMRAYAQACSPNEIGGLCSVSINKDGVPTVEDVFIVKQEVRSAHFELDDEAQVELEMQQIRSNAKGNLMMIWHSHVNMGVTPSGNDDRVLSEKAGEGSCISMIINLKGDMSARYSATVKDDWGLTSKVINPVTIQIIDTSIDYNAIKKEVKEKAIPYVAPKSIPTTYNNWNGNYGHRQASYTGGAKVSRPTIPAVVKDEPAQTQQEDEWNNYWTELLTASLESLSEAQQASIRLEAAAIGLIDEEDILEYYEDTYADQLDPSYNERIIGEDK